MVHGGVIFVHKIQNTKYDSEGVNKFCTKKKRMSSEDEFCVQVQKEKSENGCVSMLCSSMQLFF